MNDRFKLSLRGIWLSVSVLSLILPVFLPSSSNPQNFLANVIATSTVTMFILSFPSSLFGIPLLFFAQMALGVDPNSIGGMYLNLLLLFVLGLVQWFWIAPRLWRHDPDFQTLNLPLRTADFQLHEASGGDNFEFFDSRSRTPLERVINNDDSD
jgi:ascorbate-specific PTS system EIIC-type component UlaA